MTDLLSIFHYDFMVRALLAGLLIAIVAPVIGTFLVVRRYAIMADTLAHVSLVGVAASILTGFGTPIIGAAGVSVLASIGIEELRSRRRLFGESVLALFLSGSLAIAVILVGLGRGLNVNFTQYLFGSITTVTRNDILVMAAFAAVVVLVTAVCYRKFFLIAFDEELAKAGGIRVKAYNTLSMAMAAVAVSLAMQVVGGLLVGALMVIPVLTAMQFRRSFRWTLILSVVFSMIAVIVGLFSSFALDIASGGAIVVTALLLFVVSLAFGKGE